MNDKIKAGLVSGLFGLAYTLGALGLPRSTIGNPFAPIVYPLLLGILLTICGGAIFIFGIIEQSKTGKKESNKFVVTSSGKLIVLSCVAGIIYAAVFKHLGYVLSTTFFLGTILTALNGKDKWKTNIIVSIIFSISVYFLFSRLLGIPLPRLPFLDL